ncbi:MAG: hypothetical protein IPG53_18800 [Ignavibacteriales bacterium]|nr:hypothetical protein [Ignavibacteriales bacterium]
MGKILADRGLVSPFVGMWAAIFILALTGVYLFYRSVRDNATIDQASIQRFLPKRFRKSDGDVQDT